MVIGDGYERCSLYEAAAALIEDTLDGPEVYAIGAHTLIDQAIALGREGETMNASQVAGALALAFERSEKAKLEIMYSRIIMRA